MVNTCIANTKSCVYISPPYISLPMYKPTKKCLRMNISPGLIFRGLRYTRTPHLFGLKCAWPRLRWYKASWSNQQAQKAKPLNLLLILRTRWKTDSNGQRVQENGEPVLQFVAIKRKDNGQWAIPGVGVQDINIHNTKDRLALKQTRTVMSRLYN